MTGAHAAAEADHRGHVEKFARRGAASVVGAGFSAVFGIALVVIVTNGFSPTLAGTLFAATAAFLILESIALLGTDAGLVRWMPAQLAAGRGADLPRTLTIAAAPVLAFATCVAATTWVAAPRLAPILVGSDAAETMSSMLRVLAVFLPVAALHDLVVAATRGAGSMRPTVVVENVGRLGLQAAFVLVAHLAGGGPVALVVAWGLPYAFGLAASAAWLWVLVRRRTSSATSPATRWRPLGREFWSYTAARGIARVTQTALKRSDIVMVAALSSPADAALYTAASRFIVLGQLFVQSMQQALSPHLSALFAREDAAAATAVFQAATRWSVVAAWPLYLVIAGFASTLMAIFGSGYDQASVVVVVLSLTMLLATACGPVDAVLLMAGRSWLSLRNSATALAVNIALNLVLIPLDGIRGAATSWAVAIVVRNLLPLVQVRRQLGMWSVTPPAVRVGTAALVSFGVPGLVVAAADLSLVPAASLTTAGGAAYVTLVWTWRSSLDLSAFGAALRRRRRQSVVPRPRAG